MQAHMVMVHNIAIYKCSYCENTSFKKKSDFIKVKKNLTFVFLIIKKSQKEQAGSRVLIFFQGISPSTFLLGTNIKHNSGPKTQIWVTLSQQVYSLWWAQVGSISYNHFKMACLALPTQRKIEKILIFEKKQELLDIFKQ